MEKTMNRDKTDWKFLFTMITIIIVAVFLFICTIILVKNIILLLWEFVSKFFR